MQNVALPSRSLPVTLSPLLAILVLAGLGHSTTARAGGGPENVLLVVNSESASSLCIANHYAVLRQIPFSHRLYLAWDPKAETTDIDTFRQKILRPTLQAIRGAHLARQIDCVVYSSDFPWGISLAKDVEKFSKMLAEPKKSEPAEEGQSKPRASVAWPIYLTPMGSINGLTYLWEPVLGAHPGYFERHSNWYTRLAIPEQKDSPTLAFSGMTAFGSHGEELATEGRHYLMSMMLGVTAGRGNSLDEVLSYLRRSATADGTHPTGTIYYVQNGDIRSRVRQGEFPAAVRELKALGVAAEILEGVLPMNKADVLGAMLGTASFDWKSSQSSILPGAICEHFTSFGGEMHSGSGQTPLSELLRYGATAASGTVTEPYAIPNKFPAAMMHVHYARGCTVAEAFYQSIASPYQLLIVGDPLCRPWANIAEVTVSGVKPNATVQGTAQLKPFARLPGSSTVDHFELFVDGARSQTCQSGGSIELDTTKLVDGYHELRIVAIEKGPVRSQGRQILPIFTANHHRTIEVTVTEPEPAAAEKPILLTARAPGCSSLGVIRGLQVLGTISGEEGYVEIKPSVLGSGPVRLQVIGLGTSGPYSNVLSKPLDFVLP